MSILPSDRKSKEFIWDRPRKRTARIFKNQQYNEDLHNALFIGMTELDEKKYLVGLLVKDPKINGDGGGDVAAPIFSEIIETIQNF